MSELTHVDRQGKASMVDVSDKEITERVAVAESVVTMSAQTLSLIQSNEIKKGDVCANHTILIALLHP